MITTCDVSTIDLLFSVVGLRLLKISARRYPGYLAYSEVVATLANGSSIRIDLKEVQVASKFEVFVAQARVVTSTSESDEWDHFEFGDFVIAKVYLLRREEWTEQPLDAGHQMIGRHGMEAKFGVTGGSIPDRDVVMVDTGICFVSARGAELRFDADTFPLVLQLQYLVATSPVPKSMRVDVHNLHKT